MDWTFNAKSAYLTYLNDSFCSRLRTTVWTLFNYSIVALERLGNCEANLAKQENKSRNIKKYETQCNQEKYETC